MLRPSRRWFNTGSRYRLFSFLWRCVGPGPLPLRGWGFRASKKRLTDKGMPDAADNTLTTCLYSKIRRAKSLRSFSCRLLAPRRTRFRHERRSRRKIREPDGRRTMTARQNLKPCPFCGGTAVMQIRGEIWVECTDCHVNTPGFDAPEEAVAVWNRRTAADREGVQ